MAPFAEKDGISVSARVWHRHPPKARPKKARKAPAKARTAEALTQAAPADLVLQAAPVDAPLDTVEAEVRPAAKTRPAKTRPAAKTKARPAAKTKARPAAKTKARLAAAKRSASAKRAASKPTPAPSPEPAVPEPAAAEPTAPAPPARTQVPVPLRAFAPRTPRRAQARPQPEPQPEPVKPTWSPWPRGTEPAAEPSALAGDQGLERAHRPAWMIAPYHGAQDSRALEVSHDSAPGEAHVIPLPPMAWSSPEVSPFPEAGAFPEVGPFPEDDHFAEPEPVTEAESGRGPEAADAESDAPSAPAHEAGPVRRPGLSLRFGHARKPGPAQDPASSDPSSADASPAVTPAWPAAPAISSQPRARWMLRVQPRPPATQEVPAPEPLAPATEPPEQPAAPQPVPVPEAEVPAPEAEVPAPVAEAEAPVSEGPGVPAAEASVVEPSVAEAPAPQVPTAEAAAPEAPVAEAPAPEAAPAEPAVSEPPVSEPPVSEAPAPWPETASPPEPAPVAARFADTGRARPLPSIERALSGPGSRGEVSWRRQVKVVTGGQGPGKRDQEMLDRERARMPLACPRRMVVLGCTRGAGQTVTTLMISHTLAAVRGVPVAALDLNPGATSLAARRSPAASVQSWLDGQEPDQWADGVGGRLDVIADPPGTALDGDEYQRLCDLLTQRYPLTVIDPAPSGLTRVLSVADQLVLVAPASPDAATALANTQQWLGAHGYGELAGRAVTVVNGVSRRTMEDVLRAESVARGRCRAIVRVPWIELLATRPRTAAGLHPQTRLAYTALAGVLVAGMAVDPRSPVPGRNPGEHSD